MDNGELCDCLMKTAVLVSLVACGWGWPGPQAPFLDVQTTQGLARGYLAPDPPHYAFLGLPYARPYSRPERFKEPVPPEPWDGLFEAGHIVRCVQPQWPGSHGCLVVNVFMPKNARALPVMVHVHDGAFVTGWGAHDPPLRLLALSFVIVTFNYRLGAEGFLCLGTRDIPGNAGLKDQVAALYWVHENIRQFGGNPDEVTLYGTGAGAVSAELLYLSGQTQGLVHKIILESGSAISPMSLGYDHLSTAQKVASSIRQGWDEYHRLPEEKDLSSIFLNLPDDLAINDSDKFQPCIESSLNSRIILDKDPMLLYNNKIDRVPLLITYSKEILLESSLSTETAEIIHILPENFEDMLPNNLKFQSQELKFKIGQQIKDLYFGELNKGVDVAECYENYMNDVFSVYPVVKSAVMHAAASKQPVFLMEYSPQEGNKGIYEYIFNQGGLNYSDELITEKFVNLWSNFMQYSDPTPIATSPLPVVWQPVKPTIKGSKPDISTAECLIFEAGSARAMGQSSSSDKLAIWDHIYDKCYKNHEPEIMKNYEKNYEREDSGMSYPYMG